MDDLIRALLAAIRDNPPNKAERMSVLYVDFEFGKLIAAKMHVRRPRTF